VTDLVLITEGKRSVQIAPVASSAAADRRELFGRLAAAELGDSYQLAVRILSNRGDAEDAVNEAILKAWSSFDRLRDVDKFRPWFMRIVVNQCRNDLRHKKVIRMEPLVGDDHPAPDSLDGASLRDAVSRSIECLVPDQRVAVALRFWNDLSIDEIARVMGVPSGTIKGRLHTANQRIKAELGRIGWEVDL
jgi:RNA polymerase sigma-70 factor, ECF subfamily